MLKPDLSLGSKDSNLLETKLIAWKNKIDKRDSPVKTTPRKSEHSPPSSKLRDPAIESQSSSPLKQKATVSPRK